MIKPLEPDQLSNPTPMYGENVSESPKPNILILMEKINEIIAALDEVREQAGLD